MALSCACVERFPEEYGEKMWYFPTHFSILETKKRVRCKSCKKFVSNGESCVAIDRERMPYNEIEEKILDMNEDTDHLIPMAPWILCEGCGEICLNLSSLGYCFDIERDVMTDLLKQYHEKTGFKL